MKGGSEIPRCSDANVAIVALAVVEQGNHTRFIGVNGTEIGDTRCLL